MGQLTNQYVSSSFQGLLKMTDSTTGVTPTLQTVQTGDGTDTPLQISQTEVNISGSFFINNVPITNGTNGTSGTSGVAGSSGTSGSSGSNGSSGTSGQSGSSGSAGSDGSSGSSGTSGSNGSDGTSGDSLFAQTGSYWATTNDLQITGSLGITNIKGTGSLFLQPNQADARYLEVYNTSPTDTHITGSGGQLFIGDDVTYVKVDNYGTTKRIDIVADNELVISSSVVNFTGSLYQSGTLYPDVIDWFSSSIQLGTGSYVLTTNASGVTQYDTYQNVATALQPFINTGSAGGDRNGLITTGSIATTQSITGSLIVSGALINTGSLTNVGNTFMLSEAFNSGSIKLNITGSAPVSQSNFIFGSTAGPAAVTNTGSIILSGSNNIILTGVRTDTSPNGTYGYIGGNSNIMNVVPQLNTASLVRPTTNNNLLYGSTTLNFVTSSVLAIPVFTNNQTQGTVAINHQSGSINMVQNIVMGNGFSSTANTTTLNERTIIQSNLVAGLNAVTLNHNSSSIQYSGNIGGGMTVTNNYTSSAVNNITVQGNLFNGTTNTLVVTGSNSGTRRQIRDNIVIGNGNIINSNHSGSSFTGGHLSSTLIMGQNLIVSASNTSITVGGSTFVGRYNATGSLQESSQDTVFVVGTGTGDGARRNAIHIDSLNNTRITGSVTISGSLSVNGLSFTSGTSGSSGQSGTSGTSGLTDKTGLITTGSFGVTQSISGSLRITGSITNYGGGNINNNTTYGDNALPANTTGTNNLAFGNNSLQLNITGSFNTALGSNALSKSQNGKNTAIGSSALQNLTIGVSNMAIGENAMQNCVSGSNNIALGNGALVNVNTTNNTAVGAEALQNLSTGFFNTAIGYQSMASVTVSSLNIAIGNESCQSVAGDSNVGIGYQSLKNATGARNVGIGNGVLQNAQTQNIGLGFEAGKNETGDDNLYISNQAFGGISQDRSGSLIYGKMSSTTANQTLQINANTDIRFGLKVSGTTNLTGSLLVSGDVMFASGSNKTIGTVALDGANPGAATVSNSLVTANSLIFLTKQTLNHTNGYVAISSKGTGTFTITSNHNGDTDTVAYQIINPI